MEKQKNDLTRELESLQEKIEETGDLATTQKELNKKRETELAQLRTDFQSQAEENERTMSELKKKHHSAMEELQEQVSGACEGGGGACEGGGGVWRSLVVEDCMCRSVKV